MQFLKNPHDRFLSGFAPRPGSTTGSVNGQDAAAPLSDLSALSALWANFDLNQPETAGAAHRLLQPLAPTLFPTEFFSGMAADELGPALATLMLAQRVGPRHEAMQGIAPTPDDARTTLTQCLSPAGQAALQQSLENSHADNDFSKYLASADRYGVAGNLSLQHAATYLEADGLVKTPEDAGEHALKAIELYARAAQPRGAADAALLAADVWCKAAEDHTQARRFPEAAAAGLKAAEAYERAGDAYTSMHLTPLAIKAYQTAALHYESAGRHSLSAGASRRAAALFTELGEHGEASAANKDAAIQYLEAADVAPTEAEPLPVAQYYLMAAFAYEAGLKNAQAGHHTGALTAQAVKDHEAGAKEAFALAGDAFEKKGLLADAKVFYARSKLYGQVIALRQQKEVALKQEAVALNKQILNDLKAGKDRKEIARAYVALGELNRLAKLPDYKSDFRKAAELFVQLEMYKDAGDCYLNCDEFSQAARVYEQAKRFDLAGDAYRDAKLFKQAAASYMQASEQATSDTSKMELVHNARMMEYLAR